MVNKDSIFDKLKKENPFRVTDQYFDSLPEKILESVYSADNQEPANKNKMLRLKHLLAYAASFLGLIFLSYLGIQYFRLKQGHNYISKNDAIEYVSFYTSDFDEATILENIPIGKNENISANDAESESIISYLVDEGIDELTLYSEL